MLVYLKATDFVAVGSFHLTKWNVEEDQYISPTDALFEYADEYMHSYCYYVKEPCVLIKKILPNNAKLLKDVILAIVRVDDDSKEQLEVDYVPYMDELISAEVPSRVPNIKLKHI